MDHRVDPQRDHPREGSPRKPRLRDRSPLADHERVYELHIAQIELHENAEAYGENTIKNPNGKTPEVITLPKHLDEKVARSTSRSLAQSSSS